MINTMGGGVKIGSNNPQIQEIVAAEITDRDEQVAALQFLGEQKKKENFSDRLSKELEVVKRKAHHTRTKVRIMMPDGYILQATFGAAEKVQAVIDFVHQNIVHKDRPFYLYETPPKRILKEFNKTLHQARLVPSCKLHFGWEGYPETKIEHGPFIDIANLREYVV